jgi:hypothetical protein
MKFSKAYLPTIIVGIYLLLFGLALIFPGNYIENSDIIPLIFLPITFSMIWIISLLPGGIHWGFSDFLYPSFLGYLAASFIIFAFVLAINKLFVTKIFKVRKNSRFLIIILIIGILISGYLFYAKLVLNWWPFEDPERQGRLERVENLSFDVYKLTYIPDGYVIGLNTIAYKSKVYNLGLEKATYINGHRNTQFIQISQMAKNYNSPEFFCWEEGWNLNKCTKVQELQDGTEIYKVKDRVLGEKFVIEKNGTLIYFDISRLLFSEVMKIMESMEPLSKDELGDFYI